MLINSNRKICCAFNLLSYKQEKKRNNEKVKRKNFVGYKNEVLIHLKWIMVFEEIKLIKTNKSWKHERFTYNFIDGTEAYGLHLSD